MEPDESSLRVSGQMQISADGSRAMQNTFWSTSYRVLPDGADENGITGESYWATGAQSPVLDLEFQRDSNGRVAREILWSPPPPDSISPGGRWRVVGWYQYLRNSEGLLIQLIYHSHWGQDDRPLSDDDPILSRVDIDYGLGYHNPREAMIFYHTLARTSVRFDYDTSGRLTGGFRQGPWPSYFSVTNGACEAAPERLFVILLAPHGGPWYPFEGSSRRGLRPGSPR
jgi:YD repeat-containing protein